MGLCKVLIANSKQSFAFARELTYLVPESLAQKLQAGSLVMVPLRHGKENALVIETLARGSEPLAYELKAVDELIVEQLYPPDLLELIKHTANYYACSYTEVLSSILPGALIAKPTKEIKANKDFDTQNLDSTSKQIFAILVKARGGRMRYSRLKTLSKLSDTELKKEISKLIKLGAVSQTQALIKSRYKSITNPLSELSLTEESRVIPELTEDQLNVISKIHSHSEESAPKFVLHGVTGSGKTEIYLRLIDEMLKQKRSVIVLVPEISLAPQMISRISARTHEDNIVVWHSGLSKSERQYTWDKIAAARESAEPLIVVGARSAIFAPVHNLGLVVLDEEHENSYKQESPAPRYHACDLAAKRAELAGDCKVIYGSATPSVELYHKAISNEYPDYYLLELPARVHAATLPQVEIVDMRAELAAANRGIFSRALKQAVDGALEQQEQVILFLNRRGTASHVFCRTCGHVYNCPHCSSKIVYHSDQRLMICHHCGHKEAHPTQCSACAMPTIKFFGLGTQKLEEEARKAFPQARVARLDSDITSRAGAYLEILRKFKNREIDILIGTQMIAKGLDLPQLSTVGVVAADTSFMQLDYQAEERGFQLLTQVAGRAGRRDKQGRVIFQTYSPERIALQQAAQQDYRAFYEREIEERKLAAYPPYSTLLRVVSFADDDTDAVELLNNLHSYLLENLVSERCSILGPSPCLLSKLKAKHRYHLLIKSSDAQVLKQIKDLCLDFKKKSRGEETLLIDVGSISLY